MRKRTTLAAIGAAGLIIGLAACGGGSSAAQHAAAPAPPTSTTAPSTTAPSAPATSSPASTAAASAAARETCALTPSCPAPTAPAVSAPAAGTGTSPGWLSAGLQANVNTIKADYAKILTDFGQLNQDVNAKNVEAGNTEAGQVEDDGRALWGDGNTASSIASIDSGVPATFQTAMTDFSYAGNALMTFYADALSGDQATVNTDVQKFNSATKQGNAALTAALGG
jgi:hypothetical protein